MTLISNFGEIVVQLVTSIHSLNPILDRKHKKKFEFLAADSIVLFLWFSLQLLTLVNTWNTWQHIRELTVAQRVWTNKMIKGHLSFKVNGPTGYLGLSEVLPLLMLSCCHGIEWLCHWSYYLCFVIYQYQQMLSLSNEDVDFNRQI